MIKFSQSTPVGGDCTCGYDVEMDKEYTVGEFINDILADKKKEWGSFYIYTGPSVFKYVGFGYHYGELRVPICNEILEKKIEKVSARGGFSNMNYEIYLKREA